MVRSYAGRRPAAARTIVHTMSDSKAGIKTPPADISPAGPAFRKIAYSCVPSPGLSHSHEPSAAMWNTLFYTNATPQTGQRPFAWVIQLLIVPLKDENFFLEDHPSQVMMQMPCVHPGSSSQSAHPVNCSMSSMCCLERRADVPGAFVRRLIGRDNLVCIATPHG